MRELSAEREWDLAVFDASADFVASADPDENAGTASTLWVKTFVDPIRLHGGTAVVVDHVVTSGESRGYAVGSRAKKAKAKLVWEFAKKKDFSATEMGRAVVTKVKDNLSTGAPKVHTLDLGGDSDGGFVVCIP